MIAGVSMRDGRDPPTSVSPGTWAGISPPTAASGSGLAAIRVRLESVNLTRSDSVRAARIERLNESLGSGSM